MSGVLFAVDFEQKPFCIVRAWDFQQAIQIAAGFLTVRKKGEEEWLPPSLEHIAKLRARRPMEEERYVFALEASKFGEGSEVELAAMPLNG